MGRPFAHLHTRSWFSFLQGGSAPEALVARAAALRYGALALTDVDGVYGVVRFLKAASQTGVRGVVGSEMDGYGGIVLLAASREGYANLCRVVTAAHAGADEAAALWDNRKDIFCLTGAYGSRLWEYVDRGDVLLGRRWIESLRDIYEDRLSIEIAHHLLEGDGNRIRALMRLADQTGVPVVATGAVLYAEPEDYKRYDVVTCIREACTIFDAHPARPQNAEAHLQEADVLFRRLPFEAAFARSVEIAEACRLHLLPEFVTPPEPLREPGVPPHVQLRRLCEAELPNRYRPSEMTGARSQLEKELEIIRGHDLEDFFLVVHEIVSEARRRGIRCAGRGSAANSIVAYLLQITLVDPIAQNLLFERFLHAGRRVTPDIDVDFDAERRGEVIAWMEKRFGLDHTAMTATVVTYRLRSALRDVAKALGWAPNRLSTLSKSVPHSSCQRVGEYKVRLQQAAGSSPLLDLLCEVVAGMEGCPRHLGQHSGGMVLSRRPISYFSPLQTSANGVAVVQFDKDDVEGLGLVKFDVLGLRMLAALSEAQEMIQLHEGLKLDLDRLPLDDHDTMDLVRAGDTLGVFQIESQGQMHLLAMHQPERFQDLVTEVALFRPGPLQGNMVRPFVRRRRGLEPVSYPHPDLEPVLRDTYGVVLYQEQVLEIAHVFAGMSLSEADAFRRLMSKFRDPGEMEGMRGRFVGGAVGRGVPEETAQGVFDMISKFVGYGFCRAHAAAFAKTVYESAYLKCHHPAAYMAAIMQMRPGMYDLTTLETEARRLGVEVLPPAVNASGIRYDLEPGEELAIRKPLTAVHELSEDEARAIIWARLTGGPFTSMEDVCARVSLERDSLQNLARSGALDEFAADGREALWHVGVLAERLGKAGRTSHGGLFDVPIVEPEDLPPLPPLRVDERLAWDIQTHGAARTHPMILLRRHLNDMEVRPIEVCYRLGRAFRGDYSGGAIVTIAGRCMLRQRPPTANGVLFLTLEDETGFIQCIVYPRLQALLEHVLVQGAMIVRGKLQAEVNWRGLIVENAWPLQGLTAGYEGHLSYSSGRDRQVVEVDADRRSSQAPGGARAAPPRRP